MSFAYLASPFYSLDDVVMEDRYQKVLAATALFWERGITVFSPIAHCYHFKRSMTTEYDFWINHDYQILERASDLFILTLDGWEVSRGVGDEVIFSRERSIPISLYDTFLNKTAYVDLR